jgi:hypothetical protein
VREVVRPDRVAILAAAAEQQPAVRRESKVDDKAVRS